MIQFSAGARPTRLNAVLLEREQDHVADHVAVGSAGHEVLRPAGAEAVEAVDGEPGEQLQRVRAVDGQVVHVERLVEEDAGRLPRPLLVAPVGELRRHAREDVGAGLRVAQQLDGALGRPRADLRDSWWLTSVLPRPGHRTPRLALSMPPGSSPRCTAFATLKRCLRIAASASSGRPATTASTMAVVLGHGRGRASGNEDRAVLVAHGLRVQGADEAARRAVPRELEQRGVQVGVRVRRAEEVAELEQLTLALEARPQPCGARVVDPLGGLADGQTFENRAGLQDLDRLVVRDLPHARPPVRLADDEPFLLEADERRSHGAARHLERRAEVRLDEPGIGREVAADDRVAEGVVVGRRSTSVCPAYCRNVAKIVNNSVSLSIGFHDGAATRGHQGRTGRRPRARRGRQQARGRPRRRRSGGTRVRPRSRPRRAVDRPGSRIPLPQPPGCDVVLSANAAKAALDAAEAALPALRETRSMQT